MMVPAIGTVVAGVNARTGAMLADERRVGEEGVEVSAVGVTATVSRETDNPASVLVLIWKPPVRIARALPRVSPVRVMVRAPVPVAAPPVVRTIVVLVAVAAGVEVAVTPPVVAMEETVPKK